MFVNRIQREIENWSMNALEITECDVTFLEYWCLLDKARCVKRGIYRLDYINVDV